MRYYEIQRFNKTHPFAVALVRVCNCTAGEARHDWTEACDRHPPLMMRRADGTVEDADMLMSTLHEQRHNTPARTRTYNSAVEIRKPRYDFLTALELWAMDYNPRHPIANTYRRINPKRRGFLSDEYR